MRASGSGLLGETARPARGFQNVNCPTFGGLVSAGRLHRFSRFQKASLLGYLIALIATPAAAAAIVAVANQPTICRKPRITNCPMMISFEVISIIIVITGTATTPLMT